MKEKTTRPWGRTFQIVGTVSTNSPSEMMSVNSGNGQDRVATRKSNRRHSRELTGWWRTDYEGGAGRGENRSIYCGWGAGHCRDPSREVT